jgi:hypothetical protein
MALMAAFFFGQQFDGIKSAAGRWWQVTRVRWGASPQSREIVHWPPGAVTINEPFAIQPVGVTDPDVAVYSLTSSRQIRISPESDGMAKVSYKIAGGKYRTRVMHVAVEQGRIVDWLLDGR